MGQTQRKLTDSYLPFQVGSRWEYRACEVMEDENGRTSTGRPCQRFSESVTTAANAGDNTVVTEFRRKGFTPEYHFCFPDAAASETVFWYLTSKRGVFIVCSVGEESSLERDLKNPEHSLLPEPDFVFPFTEGATWDFHKWTVSAKLSKTVPAGTFDDCFKLTYEIPTRSLEKIEQKKWVCKGIGVVAYEYPGEVAGSHYRIDLMSFMISGGPMSPQRPTRALQQSTAPNRAF